MSYRNHASYNSRVDPTKNKNALQIIHLQGVVPGKGIEPSHPCGWQILSLLRLPIPPPGQHGSCEKGCNITHSRSSVQRHTPVFFRKSKHRNRYGRGTVGLLRKRTVPRLARHSQQRFFGNSILRIKRPIFFTKFIIIYLPAAGKHVPGTLSCPWHTLAAYICKRSAKVQL